MDEPTTALGDKEISRLFEILVDLSKQGVAIIYISHRLDEILRLSERITVMKDGQYVTTRNTADTNEVELVKLLAGNELNLDKKVNGNVSFDF